jgi:hypothetical protein
MSIEIVHHEVPLDDRRRAFYRPPDVSGEIILSTCAASRYGSDMPSANVEVHDERNSAMPNVLELTAFHFARSHRQARVLAFQCLNPGHFIRTHHRFTFFGQFWSLLVQSIDIVHLFIEPFVFCFLRRQPVTDQVWLETPFLSSREAWRGEILFKIPRCTNSSAISRPVHWLIGLPDFSGFSQAICSILQIWSAVICAGAPDLGKSSNRSSMLKSSNPSGCKSNHLRRHNRAVSKEVFNIFAISGVFFPAAANKMIRPRITFCCSAVRRFTNFSNPCCSVSVNFTSGGFGPGMIHSLFFRVFLSYHIPGLNSALMY